MNTSLGYLEAIEKLTIQEALFIEEFMRNGGNRVEAGYHAGLEGKRQSVMRKSLDILKTPQVQAAMGEIAKLAAENAVVSVEKVLTDLEMVKAEALVAKIDAQGNPRRDLGAFIKATELQGKYLKMFSNIDLNVSGGLDINHDLSNIPTETLEQMAALYEQAKSS